MWVFSRLTWEGGELQLLKLLRSRWDHDFPFYGMLYEVTAIRAVYSPGAAPPQALRRYRGPGSGLGLLQGHPQIPGPR